MPWFCRQCLASEVEPPFGTGARDRVGSFGPRESFEASVESFLRAAAEDPAVHVIMTTIYRTGGPESGHAAERMRPEHDLETMFNRVVRPASPGISQPNAVAVL